MELENKYTVIKNSDILKLSIDCQMYLKHVLDSIGNKNLYIVVNRDEPYVSEVINLIEENSNNRMQKEIGIKDKRINLLTETLASRDKDIETLKAEIIRQNNIIVNYMQTNANLRELADEQKKELKLRRIEVEEYLKYMETQRKIIEAMATWIDDDEDSDKSISICANSICPGDYISRKKENLCINCIINYFESEVKE